MKKFIAIIVSFFLVFTLNAQEERELSNYEKYRLAQEEERFNPAPDTIYDTVYVEVEKESEPVVNNYYYDNEPSLRFNLLFNYPWYYRSYYSYWDPWYYDHYYWNYPYYSWYWGYTPYYWPYHYRWPYYTHSHYTSWYYTSWYYPYYSTGYYNYNYSKRPRPEYTHRTRPIRQPRHTTNVRPVRERTAVVNTKSTKDYFVFQFP